MNRALIIVDAQNDFAEGGALGVQGAKDAFDRIAQHVKDHAEDYDVVVTTQDWHVDPGEHFSDSPDFSVSWPVHCNAFTSGADLYPTVAQAVDALAAEKRITIHKGEYSGAYSGFEGHVYGADSSLAEVLAARHITEADIVGVATDFCVAATARDARKEGLTVRLLADMVAAVNHSAGQMVIEEFTPHQEQPRGGSAAEDRPYQRVYGEL